MPTLPPAMLQLLRPFVPLFSTRVWLHVQVLLAGAILAPGRRTVSGALRVMGLGQDRQFQRYHRVLNRAVWSGREASRALLGLLVEALVPDGPLVIGVDETLERRRGAKIAAKGTKERAAKALSGRGEEQPRAFREGEGSNALSGLRWVCMMLLVPIPWAGRTWALPFLTALAPSERYNQRRGKRHKALTDWARQMVAQVRRWLPDRPLVFVGDSTYAAIELLASCQALPNPVAFITRLRLDAALYEPAPPRRPGQIGRPRLKGKRLPTLRQRLKDPGTSWSPIAVANWYGYGEREVEAASAVAVWYHTGLPPVQLRWVLIRDPQGRFEPQALLSTDVEASAERIIGWFVLRWQLEVTFEEVRRHLGVETQRQWSDRAILRTTPALLGLFSLVTLLAHQQPGRVPVTVQQAAWYQKASPTFSDALALVRRELWAQQPFHTSGRDPDTIIVPRTLIERLTETLCYAA